MPTGKKGKKKITFEELSEKVKVLKGKFDNEIRSGKVSAKTKIQYGEALKALRNHPAYETKEAERRKAEEEAELRKRKAEEDAARLVILKSINFDELFAKFSIAKVDPNKMSDPEFQKHQKEYLEKGLTPILPAGVKFETITIDQALGLIQEELTRIHTKAGEVDYTKLALLFETCAYLIYKAPEDEREALINNPQLNEAIQSFLKHPLLQQYSADHLLYTILGEIKKEREDWAILLKKYDVKLTKSDIRNIFNIYMMMSGSLLNRFIDRENHRKLMPLAFAESFAMRDIDDVKYMVALYRANVLGGDNDGVKAAQSLLYFVCGKENKFSSLFSACNHKVQPEIIQFLLEVSEELGINDADIVFDASSSTALNAELAILIQFNQIKYSNFINEKIPNRELTKVIRLSVARLVLLLNHGAEPDKVKIDGNIIGQVDVDLLRTFIGKSEEEIIERLDNKLNEKGFCRQVAESVLAGYEKSIIGTHIATGDSRELIKYAKSIIDTANDSLLLSFIVGLRDYKKKQGLDLEVTVLRSPSVILHAMGKYLNATKDVSEKIHGDVEIRNQALIHLRNQALIHHRKSVRVLARLLDHWKPDPAKVTLLLNEIIGRYKEIDIDENYPIPEIKILLNMGFLHPLQIAKFLLANEQKILGDGADERLVKIVKSIVETCRDFDAKSFYGHPVDESSDIFREIVKNYGATIDGTMNSVVGLCMAGSLQDFVYSVNHNEVSGNHDGNCAIAKSLKKNIISPEILGIISVINDENPIDPEFKEKAIRAFKIIKKKYSELPDVKQSIEEIFSDVAYQYFMSNGQWNSEIVTSVEFCNNEFLSNQLALLPQLRATLGEEKYQHICNNIPQLLRNINPCFESSRVNLVINSLLEAVKNCPDVDLEAIKYDIAYNVFSMKHLRVPSPIFALEKTEVDPFYKFIRMSNGSHISIFEKLLIDKYEPQELNHRITLLEYLLGDDRAKEGLKDKKIEEELFAFIGKILTSDDLEEKKKIEHSAKLFDAIFKLDHKLPAPNFDINGKAIDPMKMVIITAKTTVSVPFIAYIAKNCEGYPFSEERVAEVRTLLEGKDESLIEAICAVMSGRNPVLSNSKGGEVKIPGAGGHDVGDDAAGRTLSGASAASAESVLSPEPAQLDFKGVEKKNVVVDEDASKLKELIEELEKNNKEVGEVKDQIEHKIAKEKAEAVSRELEAEEEKRIVEERAKKDEEKRRMEEAKISATRETETRIAAAAKEAEESSKVEAVVDDSAIAVVTGPGGGKGDWQIVGGISEAKPKPPKHAPRHYVKHRKQKRDKTQPLGPKQTLGPKQIPQQQLPTAEDFPELSGAKKTPPPTNPAPPVQSVPPTPTNPAPPQAYTPPKSSEPVKEIEIAFGDFDRGEPKAIDTETEHLRRRAGFLERKNKILEEEMEMIKIRLGIGPLLKFYEEYGHRYVELQAGSRRIFHIDRENGVWNQVLKDPDDGYYYFVDEDGNSTKPQYDAEQAEIADGGAPAPNASAGNPDGTKIVGIKENQLTQ